jgi:hypothetical protein
MGAGSRITRSIPHGILHILFVCQTWGRCTPLSGPGLRICPVHTCMGTRTGPSYTACCSCLPMPTCATCTYPLRVDCCWTSELGTTYSATPTCPSRSHGVLCYGPNRSCTGRSRSRHQCVCILPMPVLCNLCARCSCSCSMRPSWKNAVVD